MLQPGSLGLELGKQGTRAGRFCPTLGSRGLLGPASQSEAVPPQPFMGLDFSELLTPAKPLLPRGAHGPCLSHLPDLVLLPAVQTPFWLFLPLQDFVGSWGECPAWGSMLLDGRTRSL